MYPLALVTLCPAPHLCLLSWFVALCVLSGSSFPSCYCPGFFNPRQISPSCFSFVLSYSYGSQHKKEHTQWLFHFLVLANSACHGRVTLYNVILLLSYTNAKTQEGYCLVSGCFSRAQTLPFFFSPRRKIQIHAVLYNYVTSKLSFSFQLFPPQTLASSQIVICVSESKAQPHRCTAAQMKLIWY